MAIKKRKTVVEFFDPYDSDHLRAYEHLKKCGLWPEDFIPEDIDCSDTLWQVGLVNKMAEAWLNEHS